MLLAGRGQFPVALSLATGCARVGDVFSFLSGLYFRGKLTYARAFASDADVHVITPTRGLQPPEAPVSFDLLREFADVDVDSAEARYRAPLDRDVRALAQRIGGHTDVVLLGSIATGKYVDVLHAVFATRLTFPIDFVGRGDMSRGALLLRAARDGRELPYAPVCNAPRHGPRAPRIADMG
jgi:hypothetical protein